MRNPKASFNTRLYNFTGILLFQSYVLLRNAIAAFNILHRNEVDFYFRASLFSNMSLHNTRQAESQKFLINVGRNCNTLHFAPGAVATWSSLLNEITSLRVFSKFYKALIKHTINHLD